MKIEDEKNLRLSDKGERKEEPMPTRVPKEKLQSNETKYQQIIIQKNVAEIKNMYIWNYKLHMYIDCVPRKSDQEQHQNIF